MQILSALPNTCELLLPLAFLSLQCMRDVSTAQEMNNIVLTSIMFRSIAK